ncbi:MAG: MFS transporter [Chloroflexi bacterium]|nr:MFS transporter [Chloroflexota bacterium]
MTITGILILASGFLLIGAASAPEITRRLRGVYYGWILVFVSGIILIITSVPIFNAMTVWAVALESHFGWSRTQLGFALSLTRMEGSLSGPIAGYMTDRFGTRLMVFTGLLIMAGGFFLFTQVQSLWMFYLAFFIMSMGNGQGGWLPVMTMLNHWFVRQRSTAMALSMAGMAFGALFLVPAIAWAVDPNEDRLGWRLTAGIVGVVVVAAAVLLPSVRPKPFSTSGHSSLSSAQSSPSSSRPGLAKAKSTALPANIKMAILMGTRSSLWPPITMMSTKPWPRRVEGGGFGSMLRTIQKIAILFSLRSCAGGISRWRWGRVAQALPLPGPSGKTLKDTLPKTTHFSLASRAKSGGS